MTHGSFNSNLSVNEVASEMLSLTASKEPQDRMLRPSSARGR